MIEVTFDRDKRLVRAVLCGLLTLEDVERFSREEQDAVRKMGLGSREFYLLEETRGDTVQSKEVVEAFQRLMLHSPLKAARIATVRSGVLTTLQTRRIVAVREGAAVFESVAEESAGKSAAVRPKDQPQHRCYRPRYAQAGLSAAGVPRNSTDCGRSSVHGSAY